jgi:hypothetical protein
LGVARLCDTIPHTEANLGNVIMNAVSIAKTTAVVLASAALLGSLPARAEIEGECSKAVGTFLTKNDLDNNGRAGTSRSLLVLTNGGHALRVDSDQKAATMDFRSFGDSVGAWRCDGVDDDGTIRLTVSTLDFTYPNAEVYPGQIGRIDATGTYKPTTGTMVLDGKLAFLSMGSDAQEANALSKASSTISVKFTGQRIDLPKTP